jgi:hypothetical protein
VTPGLSAVTQQGSEPIRHPFLGENRPRKVIMIELPIGDVFTRPWRQGNRVKE